MDGGKEVWISAMATNGAIAVLVVGMSALIGFQSFLLVQLPITLLASSIGMWLFYVQHQFEDTYWDRQDDWSFHAGAMQGSTFSTYLRRSAGSPPTSGSIMFITLRAGSRAIAWVRCCGIIRSCAR